MFQIIKESSNYNRELKNREKEKEMQTALREYNEGLKENDEYKKHRSNLLRRVDQSSMTPSTSNQTFQSVYHSAGSVQVHCRECSNFLFKGSDLRYRTPSYICTNKEFIQEKIGIDRETKKFSCSNKSCNRELGRLVELRNRPPLHMIDIKGIKLLVRGTNFISSIKKWSQVLQYFNIENY